MTTCYKVWTIARSTVRRTIRRIVRHTHTAWIVSIVCVGAPLAAVPFVPMIPATNAHEMEYEPWSDRGEWPVDPPVEIPAPGMISILSGILFLALSRRKPI